MSSRAWSLGVMLKAAARLFQVNLLALVGGLAGLYELVRRVLSLREACD